MLSPTQLGKLAFALILNYTDKIYSTHEIHTATVSCALEQHVIVALMQKVIIGAKDCTLCACVP